MISLDVTGTEEVSKLLVMRSEESISDSAGGTEIAEETPGMTLLLTEGNGVEEITVICC